MPEIISRKEAMALGLKRYFTGGACSHGHTAERYVSGRKCVTCGHAGFKKTRAASLDEYRRKERERRASRQARDPVSFREIQRRWEVKNIHRKREYNRRAGLKRTIAAQVLRSLGIKIEEMINVP